MHPVHFVSVFTLVLLSCACSSSPKQTTTPQQTNDQPIESKAAVEEVEAEEICKDETCFECGEHLCLPGSICAENAAEGSCIWLQECSPDPSCDCILPLVASDCSCEDGEKGPTLRCSH